MRKFFYFIIFISTISNAQKTSEFNGLNMDPDGSRAFVACSPDNYVAIIDLKTLEVTKHIDVGGVPDGLAWAVQH